MQFRLGILALLLLNPASALAQIVAGSAEVIDGDTLTIGETKIRLYGIDAPEAQQACQLDGADWTCGREAARQLQSLIAGSQVVCRGKDTDQYGRTVAVCEAAGIELNRAMVAHGWATAFRRYSNDYIGEEFRAKANHAGIWRSTFVLPEEWRTATETAAEHTYPAPGRSSRQPQARAVAPSSNGCMIKGNRNRKGQWIYHLPGMPYYHATRPEEWFCTEAQAQAAGYSRAIVR